MPQTKKRIKNWILDNGSYKLVALFVTVILWVTILGRRDFILTRDMRLETLVPAPYVLAEPLPPSQVQVRVSGSRVALKKFTQSPDVIVLDLGRVAEGTRHVVIPPESVDLPFGVKLLSITPQRVTLQIAKPETIDAKQKK